MELTKYPTQQIIDLVQASLDYTEWLLLQRPQLREAYSPRQFLEWFKTTTIKLPRGAGHTPAIIDLLLKYPESIILTPTYYQAVNLSKHLFNSPQLDRINSVDMYKKGALINMVFVDDYSRLTPQQIDKVYELASQSKQIHFVFLN